jgi:hypothetical protein
VRVGGHQSDAGEAAGGQVAEEPQPAGAVFGGGCGFGEASALLWREVDLDLGALRVAPTLIRSIRHAESPDGDRRRVAVCASTSKLLGGGKIERKKWAMIIDLRTTIRVIA